MGVRIIFDIRVMTGVSMRGGVGWFGVGWGGVGRAYRMRSPVALVA